MQYPNMKRPEKSLSDSEIKKIILKAKYGVLSLCGEGLPYGVPLSHAMDGDTIYFHCAEKGFKIDLIKSNPKGHFVFVSHAKILPDKATVDYKSAMAYGTLRIVDTPEERKKAFSAIVAQYMKKYPKQAKDIIAKSGAKTALVAMDIEGMSGKGAANKKSKAADIATPIKIKNIQIRNRIVMPPMVRIGHKRNNGMLSENDYEYYCAPAKHGTGLIVVEATAVHESGYSFKNGLKLWDESHIDQYKKLTENIKNNGAAVFIQLQHGGFKSRKDIGEPISASDYDDGKFQARAMSTEEADNLVEAFAQAALRAQKAGFDGVQLHGCHGYLINQFSCPTTNKRDDKYAKSSAFGAAVIRRIKELCDDDFIISVRAGIDSPTIDNSLQTAIDYQNAGADMLSISQGINSEPFSAPKDWDFSDISYLGYLAKQKLNVPVVGVYGITTGRQVNKLLKGKYFDMAAVGRNHLIHPDWAKRALSGDDISKCRHCKKGCYFFNDFKKCPAIEKGIKNGYIK